MERLRQHHISFTYALEGIAWAFKTQPNFKIHLLLAFIALLCGIFVELNTNEWILLVFVIIWALSAEMINTSIEAVTDLVTTQWHKEAKIAKDVAAGMMLTVAMGSFIIACLLILPKLILKIF